LRASVFSLLTLMACSSAQPAASTDTAFAPTITRDAYGVPSVHGRNDAEAAHGLAVAHAEDDFATIQRVIVAARGRLGALEGIDGARSDFLWHVLRVEEAVTEGYERDLSADTRALVEAYAAGLNAYGAAHPRERIDGARNVRGQDIVAGFVLTSPLFWGFDRVLGKLVEGEESVCATRPRPLTVPERGSNAFAVAPSRADDGHTRLLINSHQPWEGPVAWYEAMVSSDTGWRMHGGVFPGAPLPLMGTNGALGWAPTVNEPDLVDLYRLHTDPRQRERYRFDGAWRAFDKETIWLQVRFGPVVIPVPRTLRFSVHGPAFETPDGWIAARYAGAGDIRMVEQYYRMGRARSLEEWRAALDMRAIASTNYVYADATGRIALMYNASLPRRAPGYDWSGCVPGDVSATLWRQGDWADPPALIEPASGWLYSANGTPFSATDPDADLDPADYPAELGIEMHMTNRGHRAVELLSPLASISEAQLLAAKFDVTYSTRSAMREMVRDILAAPEPDLAAAQAVLRRWDFRAVADSREAALALLAYAPIRRAQRLGQSSPSATTTVREAARTLEAGFGRLDPPLGEALRLRRGSVDLPLDGGPDLLRAIGWTIDPDHHMSADFGDGLIMLVDWSPDGAMRVRSVHQYGAATGRPDSHHFNDQATLFARHEFRP
jgi:acyl-homoserine lactone acylase PvdQ